MAAILGIVASLVGPVIEIGKCVASPIKRQFTYLCCFDSNIRKLRDEARNLENERDGLQREVDAATNNAELIVPIVTTWLEKVTNKIQVEKRGIVDEIPTLKHGFRGIKSRYRLSREATKVTREMKQLVEDRHKFNHISKPPPPAAHVPIPLGKTYEFQSRKQIEEEIMEALRGKDIRTMGICGMGGVGKTTMAKRIMSRAKEENVLEEILMAVVGQQVDMLKIQDEIAESLGLRLEEKTLSARANKLRARLTGANAKRMLIVLDDLWGNLKLDDLGISGGNDPRCTILLTSRNRDVLNKMDAQKICAVEILSKAEAWFLFREKAGACVDKKNLCSIAVSVAEECKGLPIALITVGGALKDKTTITFWEDAMQQLKSFNPEDMPDVIKDVYNPLKLSYTYLESRHAKSLFLLCSLFPEDADINLEDLTLYCMGLRIFCNLDFPDTSEGTLEKVRNRVFIIVDMLKNRFLLLKGGDEHHVKMHDVVRDVAIYIASNKAKEGKVDVKFNSMCSSREYTFTWASVLSEKFSTLLRMHGLYRERRFEIKDSSLFEEMKEINVLSFQNISLKSLSLEIQLLMNLRTLRLESCKLDSLSFVGELLSLESLYCHSCSGIVKFPVEIGKLNQLKLLDFSYCRSLETIPPGVISNLVELEEFKMLGSFSGWESVATVHGQERSNASLNEFENLSKLTRLEIEINDLNLAAEEIHFSPNISKYLIRIGDMYDPPYGSSHEIRGVYMNLWRGIKLGNWVLRFLRRSNDLHLKGNGYNCTFDLPQTHGMKSLTLEDWSTVKRLVNPTTSIDDHSEFDVFPILDSLVLYNLPRLEEIFDCQVLDQSNSFKNLRELRLVNMPALKHLCKRPDEIISLDNLRSIKIRKCSNLLHLFSFPMDDQNHMNDSVGINRISTSCQVVDLLCVQKAHFPLLEELELSKLDKLEVIWNVPVPKRCNSFKNLRELRLSYLPAMTHLWKSPSQNVSLNNLSKIYVRECHKLRNLFSSKMSMDSILQLERLEIKSCDLMEQVVLLNEDGENDTNQCRTIRFPKLSKLTLNSLESLTTFSKGIETIEFPMLVNMNVRDCPKPMSFLSSTGNNQNLAEGHDKDTFHLFCFEKVSFGNLKEISIGMDDKSIIWCHQIPLDFFGQLETLEITYCNNIRNLFSSSIAKNLVSLKKLTIGNNNEMVKVIEGFEEILYEKPLMLFPSLKELQFLCLSKLESFCNRRCDLQLPSLELVKIENCHLLEFFTMKSISFGSLKEISIGMDDKNIIWGRHIPLGFFNQLEELEITSCNGIRSLFPFSIAENLVNLKKLTSSFCYEMVKVIENDEGMLCENKPVILLPSLKELQFSYLSKLDSFCNSRCELQLPSLEFVKIENCPLLEFFTMESALFHSLKTIVVHDCNNIGSLFSSSMSENLVNLKQLDIRKCNEMVKVIDDNEEMSCGKSHSHLLFPCLMNLNLVDIPKLESFCNWRCNLQLPALERVTIEKCPLLELLNMRSISAPNLKHNNENDGILVDSSFETEIRFRLNIY